jgi:chromosome segregation ATPase
LNVICGPNGAGKSSILLAISVAMGQIYTERGRKLSDLIRWGEDQARVTLVFDNKMKENQRSIPRYDVDDLRVSRYLNREGNYWFEVNFQPVNKTEINEIFQLFGINPDNMLILMHQHMMMEFGTTTSEKKLQMVEDAVGFTKYRNHVLEAHNKLNQVLSEESSIASLLKNAEQTLEYWKKEYAKYQQKKELIEKKSLLERELGWSQLIKKEATINTWKTKVSTKEKSLTKIELDIEQNTKANNQIKERLNHLQQEKNTLYQSQIQTKMEYSQIEETSTRLGKKLDDFRNYQQIISAINRKLETYPEFKTRKSIPNSGKGNIVNSNEIESQKKIRQPQVFETAFTQLQVKNQLIFQEIDKLENENTVLTKLIQQQKSQEKRLTQHRKKLKDLVSIQNQIGPQLDNLQRVKTLFKKENTRKNNLIGELNGLIKRVAPIVECDISQSPGELIHEILKRIKIEIDVRLPITSLIEKTNSKIEELTESQRSTTTKIQILTKQMDTLTQQARDLRHCLNEGKDHTYLTCERCGSTLPSDQWKYRLTEVEAQLTSLKDHLSDSKQNLSKAREQLSQEKAEQKRLLQEKQILDRITIVASQLQQIQVELGTIEEHDDEQNRIIRDLGKILKIKKSSVTLEIIEQQIKTIQNEIHELQREISRDQNDLDTLLELHIKTQQERVEKARKTINDHLETLPTTSRELDFFTSQLQTRLERVDKDRTRMREKIKTIQQTLDNIEKKIVKTTEDYHDINAQRAVITFKKEKVENEITWLKKELGKAQEELNQLQPLLDTIGDRIETERNITEITGDIRVIDTYLHMYKDVSEDVETMYLKYLNLFSDLKEKADVVSSNREKALQEVDERKIIWNKVLQALLDEINPVFKRILEKIHATGYVELIDAHDLEAAGLELIVGFKGGEPHLFDSHTQSGGERSSATMAFLLALQRHIRSPFRAVDEFDVHMDPINRETISQMLLDETYKEIHSQYLTITPGTITEVRDDIHVITVQRNQDLSEIEVLVKAVQTIT